jgi:O-antigen/teichoic acid export membrane protein
MRRTPAHSHLRTITKNVLANFARLGATWLVVLTLPPLLVRILDKPTYATWMLILQLAAYISVFDGGVQLAIARFVARAEGTRDHRYLKEILSSVGFVLVILSAIALSAVCLFSWELPRFFHNIPPSIVHDAQRASLAIGLSLAISVPFSTLAGFFSGLQRNEVISLAVAIGKLVGAAGVAWAAFHRQGISTMAAWMALGNVIQSLIYVGAWRRLAPRSLLQRPFVKTAVIREFLTFCSTLLITQCATILITGLDMPIVAAMDFHAAAYYAVAATVSNMLIIPQQAIVSTLMPIASGMSVADTADRMGEVLIKTTRYATAILCLITLPLMLGAYPFLHIWVGKDYALHSLPFAEILIAAQWLRLTLMPYATIGFSVGQQRQMLTSAFVEGALNLTCSLIAAHFLGALGVAIGTSVGACAGVYVHFFNSMPRTNLILFRRWRLLAKGILQPTLLSLPLGFLALVLTHLVNAPLLKVLFIAGGEAMAFLLLWRYNFSPQEREALATSFGRAIHFSWKPMNVEV